jgi:diguanylate cyclase
MTFSTDTAPTNIKHKPTATKISKMLTEIGSHSITSRLDLKQTLAYATNLDESPSVVSLLKKTKPILETATCLEVLEIFQRNLSIFAIPVINTNKSPTGIVERNAFVEFFVQAYTKEIFGKKKVLEFMNQSPLIVDKDTPIDDITRIIIDAGMQHMVNGFIATDNGEYLGIANGLDLLNDVTLRKQNHLFYLAHYDQLTKLPNRTLFLDRLSMAISQAERHQTKVGVLFIDLDNFKHFNDSMGHSVGDKVLIEAANRLLNCARESDTVSRLSGDEFTIILDNVDNIESIKMLSNRILNALNQPLKILEREMFITASMGFAIYPNDDKDLTGLLVKADAAMYEAKRSGRNAYRQYIPGMSLYSLEHMSLETDLRMALEQNAFELFYQPQVQLSTGEVVGNEALIRWHHPERGLLTPIHFIEIIEKTGLIVPIGKWVLQEACMQQMRWIESGLKPMRISVNISAMQFYQPDFCDMVQSIITLSGIEPNYLELELTETLCMTDVVTVLKNLQDLHNLGIRLAIDDFGTGYSNLSYLKKYPIDSIKLDQSFIRNIDQEPVNVGIATAIADLGKSMSLELVAEGVETESELALVKSCGFMCVQGYLFSKPLPANQLETWLKEQKH